MLLKLIYVVQTLINYSFQQKQSLFMYEKLNVAHLAPWPIGPHPPLPVTTMLQEKSIRFSDKSHSRDLSVRRITKQAFSVPVSIRRPSQNERLQ